jgi:hypothetical protein
MPVSPSGADCTCYLCTVVYCWLNPSLWSVCLARLGWAGQDECIPVAHLVRSCMPCIIYAPLHLYSECKFPALQASPVSLCWEVRMFRLQPVHLCGACRHRCAYCVYTIGCMCELPRVPVLTIDRCIALCNNPIV